MFISQLPSILESSSSFHFYFTLIFIWYWFEWTTYLHSIIFHPIPFFIVIPFHWEEIRSLFSHLVIEDLLLVSWFNSTSPFHYQNTLSMKWQSDLNVITLFYQSISLLFQSNTISISPIPFCLSLSSLSIIILSSNCWWMMDRVIWDEWMFVYQCVHSVFYPHYC